MSASSGSFGSTVDLSPQPSVRALRWAFGLHVLCLALLLAAEPPVLPMLLIATAIGASWLWLRRHPALGFGPRALTRLIWHAEGDWTLQRADGKQFEAELLPDSIVRGWLVLRFRLADGSTTARMLAGDELPAESLRRLRARLSSA